MNQLRVLRAQKRVSQLEIAAGAGIGATRYWKIENGYTEPTPEERRAIARALGVSIRKAWPVARRSVRESQPAA
jgi:transcriptional regulator with XRE-family HTH domain